MTSGPVRKHTRLYPPSAKYKYRDGTIGDDENRIFVDERASLEISTPIIILFSLFYLAARLPLKMCEIFGGVLVSNT